MFLKLITFLTLIILMCNISSVLNNQTDEPITISDPKDLFVCNMDKKQFFYIYEFIINSKKHINCFHLYLEAIYKVTLANGSTALTNIYVTGEKGCQELTQKSSDFCPIIKRYRVLENKEIVVFHGVPHLVSSDGANKFIRNKFWENSAARWALYMLNFKIEAYNYQEDDANYKEILKLIALFGFVPLLSIMSPIFRRQIFIYKSNEASYFDYEEKKKREKMKKFK